MIRLDVSSYNPCPSWLSEEGLKTLQRGYLLPGETPRDLYGRIAYTAAKYLEREDLQQDFFDILYKGYLGLATPVASNFGTTRGLPISCLETGTKIHTKNGFKEIQDLKKGDLVLTHLGNWKPVNNVWSRDTTDDLYLLTVNKRSGDPLNITGNHPVLTQEGWVKVEDLNSDRHLIVTSYSTSINTGIESNGSFYGVDAYSDFIVSKQSRNTTVWDIEVADDHSFIAQGVVVHNCFSVSVGDSIPSIYSHLKEVAMMSKNGGGVGIYYGNVRCSGSPIGSTNGVSTGVVPVANQYDVCSRYVTQGNVRRGAFAHYINADHPDAYELLLAKDHLEGDPRQMIDGNIAFVVTDEFMMKVMGGDENAKKVWSKALEMNLKVGSPYFIFIDNVNARNPQAYINHGLKVETSNLCSEIMLYTDENHSFVCCLSSLNLFKWDEWKNWRGMNSGKSVVELSIYILDAVMEEFIKRAGNMTGMGRAVRSAQKGRALGLGVMGLHYLYQKHMLPFKSKEARELNIAIHKQIKEEAVKASQDLAKEYGEPTWCEGTGMRNTHLLAVAPTRTNSVISGAFSPGIEPIDSNSYTAKQAKGSFIRKNGLLKDLLASKGLDTPETWDQILHDNGSVMNIDGLTIAEKLVFLTAREIDPEELVRQACDRTPFICQGQSLNRYVHPDIPIKKFNDLVFKAWAGGTKSTYYTKSSSEKVIAKVANQAHIITRDDCPYCEKAKLLFTKLGIQYTEYKREDVPHFPWKTVPQIWYQGHYIGGYDDLLEFLAVKKQKVAERQMDHTEAVRAALENVVEQEGCSSCEG